MIQSAPCRGCGTAIQRTRPTGSIPAYCGDDCKPRCSVRECDRVRSSRGWCTFHYTRWAATGDPLTPLLRGKNSGCCSVDGCEQPMRKRGWCASHYAQWQREGQVRPFTYKWGERTECKVCGGPSAPGFRTFCGGACAILWRTYGGVVPSAVTCVGCGVSIDLTRRGKGGQRRKASTKFCRRCKQDYNKYKMTAAQLAERDGSDCGICGYPVDMTIRRSDPDGLFCPSVDHIFPRALGGSHEPDNLQLAHLWCNQVKSDLRGAVA